MSDWRNLYPAVSSFSIPTTAPITVNTTEVNLRTEFDSLILGGSGQTPIGQTFILRRMRRDDDNEMIRCSCVDTVANEPDRDTICTYCYGCGYLWDEELVAGYKVVAASPGGTNAAMNSPSAPAGDMYLPSTRFFFSYDIAMDRHDRIIEIELDEDGDPVEPYVRTGVYEVMLIRDMRGDNGKIEFWVVNGQKMGPNTLGAIS